MNRIKKGLKKRKIKIFLIFLLVSSLAWFISELSGDYSGRAVFDVEYNNIPDSLLFVGASRNKVDVKLTANGFTFLRFNFGNKKVTIDATKAELKNGVYSVPKSVYQLQIEQQLPKSMDLVRVYNEDDIVLEMYELLNKKIPVVSSLQVELNQNYMLDGALKIAPDSIIVRGSKKELDKITKVLTVSKKIDDISEDFSEKLALTIPEKVKNLTYLKKEVVITGKIALFSEKIIEVPIVVTDLPEDFEISIFPDTVAILCKAKIEDLKKLKPSDFKVVADYTTVKNKEKQTIELSLVNYPEVMNTPKLMVSEVRYILKRK